MHITAAELAADQRAEAAMRALHEFRRKHWQHLSRRRDPFEIHISTAIEREANRLHAAAAQANREALDAEHSAR